MPIGCFSPLCSVPHFLIKNLHEDKEGILVKSSDDDKPGELTNSMDSRGNQQNLYNLLTLQFVSKIQQNTS